MQVFRAYLKVLRSSAGVISIYLIVFIGLAVMFTVMSPSTAITEFTETRTPIAVINRDEGAPLAQGLADYVADTFNVVSYPDDPEKLQDALFYRNVEYVMIIPRGFSEAFMSFGMNEAEDIDGAAVIQKVVVPASTSSHYVDLRIDKFLNTASIHRDFGIGSVAEGNTEDLQTRLVAAVRTDLSAADTLVLMRTAGGTGARAAQASASAYESYFAYASYALLCMIMLGISSIMIAFNRPDLRLRILCAPVSRRRFDLSIAAGHAMFALVCSAILALLSLVIYRSDFLLSGLAGLYFGNMLVFAVLATSIGFAVGHFVKTSSGQSGAVNVIGLGMSFLGGVFVPQSIMSSSVLAFSKFLPSYWYVRANDAIAALSSSASRDPNSVYGPMLIQLGFAVAIFSVTLLFRKERQMAELQ